MASEFVHPGLLVVVAGFALALLGGRARAALALLAPLAALGLILAAPAGVAWSGTWLGFDVRPLAYDALSRLFAVIFATMAFAGGLYALNQKSRLELPAAYVYAGAAIGAVLAG